MEKVNNNPLSSEDIEKVRQVAEGTKSEILLMGNTDNKEFERIDKLFESFVLANGKETVEVAINKLRAVPWSKQEV